MTNIDTVNTVKQPRRGCRDIWNAFMAEGALYDDFDIPFCPTTADKIPDEMITWDEAKAIYKKKLKEDAKFFYNAFVCFYIDDYKFDGAKGTWHDSDKALKIIRHFAGVITPDFSTYQDFPEPLKIYATYRMRLYGYWLGKNGIKVINNVRWGTPETWKYCYNGIPKNSIISIGTVGGGPRKLADRTRFEEGISKMVEILKPHTIIVYGSANGKCFEKLKEQGIRIISFQSRTAKVFEGRKHYE